MPSDGRNGERLFSVLCVVAAIVWGGWIVHQIRQADDGGPPMGAMCLAVPAIALLIFAGMAWPKRNA